MCVWVCRWTTRTVSCEVAPGQLSHAVCHRNSPTNRHTSTLPPPLISSHSLSFALSLSLHATTGQADGSPSAHRARKSMWIKGYTQQVWRAARVIAVRQRGGPQPTCLPGSGTSGWGFVEWWACCRQPLLLPPRPAPCRKEKPASVQFFCSQMKQMSGCSSVWWTARLCPCAFVCYFEARGPGSGDALYLYHWMWWLVWATLALGKVKVKSQNVAM